MKNETRSFLQKDYELKIRYLADHYTRMWSRCNFFVGLETALTVALFGWFKDRGGFARDSTFIAVVGAVSCACWYCFGAQDRYLGEIYRKQVKLLGEILEGDFELSTELKDRYKDYTYVGDTASRLGMNFYQWRKDLISTTKLVVWFPVLVFVYWLTMLWLIMRR